MHHQDHRLKRFMYAPAPADTSTSSQCRLCRKRAVASNKPHQIPRYHLPPRKQEQSSNSSPSLTSPNGLRIATVSISASRKTRSNTEICWPRDVICRRQSPVSNAFAVNNFNGHQWFRERCIAELVTARVSFLGIRVVIPPTVESKG